MSGIYDRRLAKPLAKPPDTDAERAVSHTDPLGNDPLRYPARNGIEDRTLLIGESFVERTREPLEGG